MLPPNQKDLAIPVGCSRWLRSTARPQCPNSTSRSVYFQPVYRQACGERRGQARAVFLGSGWGVPTPLGEFLGSSSYVKRKARERPRKEPHRRSATHRRGKPQLRALDSGIS